LGCKEEVDCGPIIPGGAIISASQKLVFPNDSFSKVKHDTTKIFSAEETQKFSTLSNVMK